jgi:hypothetical protein
MAGEEAQEELEALKADGDAEALRGTLDTMRRELEAARAARDELQVSVANLMQQLADTKVRALVCLLLRLGRFGFGTGRQRMALERETPPYTSWRTCSPQYGLHS